MKNELKVNQQNGVINTNLDAIEAEIKEQMKEYEDYLVTEDSIKDDKKVLADLRKTKTALDNARKDVKKAWLQPYEEFEERCKSVISLVDDKINLINDQLKLFDEERVAKKFEHIKDLYDENIKGLEKFLPFEKVVEANPKWKNVTYTDQDILYDLSGMVLKVKTDLSAIKALGSEIEDECIRTYISFNNDLSMAIQRNSQYLSDKAKVVEQNKEVSKPMKQLDDLAKTIRMHHFIVSEADAEQVRDMLGFANITFREE